MNTFHVLSRSLIFAFSFLIFSTSSYAASLLYMNSEAGDYIGQGQEWSLTDINNTITATKNFDNGVTVNINGATFWNLNFAASGDVLLSAGAYENATRFPFQSPTVPGLNVSGDGRGCNTLTGRFVIHEVLYSATDTIDAFAADFEQHCEGGTPALFGSIRVNSTIPVNVVEPIASAGPDQYVVQDTIVTLDGSNSSSGAGSNITSHYWTQVSGPYVILNAMDTAVASFIAPDVNLGGETLVFELQILDTSSVIATDTVSITVASKSDPMTYVHMSSDSGDYIGQGQNYDFNQNTGIFTYDSTDIDVAKISYQGESYWSFNFGAIQGTGLTIGTYLNATRFLTTTTNPVMSISGAGRGCNKLEGLFEVLDVSRDIDEKISTLAIDFEQHCEGFVPALYGQVRVNYVDPSVPTADAGVDTSVASGETVTLSAINSTDGDGSVVGYRWTQVSGIPLNIIDPYTPQLNFNAPLVAAGLTEILVFQVEVTDNLGFKAVDTVEVTVIGMDQLSYCTSKGNSTNWEWIDAVTIGDLNNNSGNNNGYLDYTSMSGFSYAQGESVNVSLNPGFGSGSYNENWAVWIDLNHNMEFEASELLFSGSSNGLVSGSLVIPDIALLGETQMRVTMQYGGAPTPCGNFTYGEVEDYTINIVEGGLTPPNPEPGPISYCPASGNNSSYEWIESVAIGTNGNVIGEVTGNNQGYLDLTNSPTPFKIQLANQISVSLAPGFSGSQYSENWQIWIDFNQDGEFGLDESIYVGSSNTNLNATVILRAGITEMTTRMRVVMKYGSLPQPCGNFTYGEVEDFTVQLYK